MFRHGFVSFALVLALVLPVGVPGASALGDDRASSAPIELKTSQARLLVDGEGRVALEPNDAACPAPAPFRTPLWLITLAEGTDAFRPRHETHVSMLAFCGIRVGLVPRPTLRNFRKGGVL